MNPTRLERFLRSSPVRPRPRNRGWPTLVSLASLSSWLSFGAVAHAQPSEPPAAPLERTPPPTAAWRMPATSPSGATVGWTGPPYGAPRGATSYYTPPYPPPSGPTSPALGRSEVPPGDQPRSDGEDPPFFDLSVGTYVPISMGAAVGLELPGRLLAQVDVGWMPGMFGSAINGLVQDFGAYDSAVGGLVDGALDGAVVVRLSAGWRPFPSAGFEILGGYTSISLSGSASPADILAVVGGEYAQAVASQPLTGDVSLSSQLHNFHVALGWRWVVLHHLVLRANIGYTQTLGSSSEVDIPGHADLAGLANPTVDSILDDIYTSYVKLPVVGLSAGYRF